MTYLTERQAQRKAAHDALIAAVEAERSDREARS